MPPFRPTARELVLLAALLASLLYYTATTPRHSHTIEDIIAHAPHVVHDELDQLPSTFETQYTLQALNPPLRWGEGQVPETEIVAHVPGECTSLDLRLRLYESNTRLGPMDLVCCWPASALEETCYVKISFTPLASDGASYGMSSDRCFVLECFRRVHA